jgi:hypothetical protein
VHHELLSPPSAALAEELLRLSVLLGRPAAPADLIAAVRGDPEHPLHSEFPALASDRACAARLALLVSRMRLEQGLPAACPPGGEQSGAVIVSLLPSQQEAPAALTACERQAQVYALQAAVAGLTETSSAHWPAILAANAEGIARQLIGQIEFARRQRMQSP